jgi:four helix bundle protein
LAKQLLRSGTSIGANVEEAIAGQSNKDFHSKLYIAYKESRETRYWLHLLHDAGLIDDNTYQSIIADCEELIRILSSIAKTTKSKINSPNS